MAEDTKKPETEAKPEKAKPVVPVVYLLKSVARGRTNRTARVAISGRIPFVQRIAGGTILVRRARPARISEAALKANLKEIQGLVDRCQLEVTTLDGRHVDLKVFGAGPLAASKPLPNPPLDSAKNDKNANVGYEVPPTPEGTTSGSKVPELLEQGSLLEGTDDEDGMDVDPEPETVQTGSASSSKPKGKKGRRG